MFDPWLLGLKWLWLDMFSDHRLLSPRVTIIDPQWWVPGGYLIVVGNPNKIWIGKGLQIIGLVLDCVFVIVICYYHLLLITMMHILMQLFDSMSVWSLASGSEMVMVGYVQWSSIFKPQGNHHRPSMVGTWWYLIVVGSPNKIWIGKGLQIIGLVLDCVFVIAICYYW